MKRRKSRSDGGTAAPLTAYAIVFGAYLLYHLHILT